MIVSRNKAPTYLARYLLANSAPRCRPLRLEPRCPGVGVLVSKRGLSQQQQQQEEQGPFSQTPSHEESDKSARRSSSNSAYLKPSVFIYSPVVSPTTTSASTSTHTSSMSTKLNALAGSFTTTATNAAAVSSPAPSSSPELQGGVQNQQSRPRAAPSKQSGGIPSPSASYLTQALRPPTERSSPRRILVVLDLNGTLLYRPSRRHPSRFVQRPHAQNFLAYCLDTFYLAIWSSARPQNVSNMISQILTPEQRKRCVVIWARDKLGLSRDDYDARVQVYKRLSELWNDPLVRASHPAAGEGGRWDQSNTVLVDDSREKGRSEPYNILPIPEFVGLNAETGDVLPQVHDYLNHLCFQDDVSRYMRETPFALNPAYNLSHTS